ncbi:hypothetical protein BaRGS_00019213 [Batillaria attramentaria]|uniref:Uncharacterized protein n=1 Tax=Batillaria attramentaria TaxID=370345 RepID=A0ABD0KRP9_9CAEN
MVPKGARPYTSSFISGHGESRVSCKPGDKGTLWWGAARTAPAVPGLRTQFWEGISLRPAWVLNFTSDHGNVHTARLLWASLSAHDVLHYKYVTCQVHSDLLSLSLLPNW